MKTNTTGALFDSLRPYLAVRLANGESNVDALRSAIEDMSRATRDGFWSVVDGRVLTMHSAEVDVDCDAYSCSAQIVSPVRDGMRWTVYFGFQHDERFVVAHSRNARTYASNAAALRAARRWVTSRT